MPKTASKALRPSEDFRNSVVVMAATLTTYGSALLLADAARLHVGIVVQAVALAWTLAWTQRDADLVDLTASLLVLPAAAVAAVGTGELMSESSAAGSVLFAVAVAVFIWLRRFGPRAARAGILASLAQIVTLVVQGPIGVAAEANDDRLLWAAPVALIAAGCVLLVKVASGRLGLVEPVRLRRIPPPVAPTRPAPAAKGRARPLPSTRMAAQTGLALGAAFLIGHIVCPDHWTWVALTAFVVCGGARGRADVLYKGVTRTCGAAVGTVAATGVVGLFGPRDPRAVAPLFAALALATWLRPRNYAWWAAGVTAVFSLLYGYFGALSLEILGQRLEAIALGAGLGITVSWLVAPVRTVDVVRRRVADALAVLTDILGALDATAGRHGDLGRHGARFDEAVRLLDQVAPPLRIHRALVGRVRGISARRLTEPAPAPRLADAIDAIHACVEPVRALAAADGDHLDALAADASVASLLASVTAVRLAIGRLPGPAYLPAAMRAGAVGDIDAALARIAQVFPSTVPGRSLTSPDPEGTVAL